MKKIFIPIVAYTLATIQANAQLPTIANGNMELWSESSITTLTPPFTFTYIAPTNFSGLDKALGNLSGPLSLAGIDLALARQVFKSSEKYEGEWAAKLMSLNVSDTLGVIPSIMMNGNITIDPLSALGALDGSASDISDIFTMTGGTPVLGRMVDSFSVYVLAPADNPDNSLITITALKRMTIDGSDTLMAIGAGSIIVDPMAGYQRVVVPMSYNDPAETITDTFRVMIMSSTPSPSTESMFGATDSNAIYVDKMELYTSDGITSIGSGTPTIYLGFSLYPNPAVGDRLTISNQQTLASSICIIYDIQGKIMHHQEIPVSGLELDLSKYPSGTYYYHIQNQENTAKQTGKFVKP